MHAFTIIHLFAGFTPEVKNGHALSHVAARRVRWPVVYHYPGARPAVAVTQESCRCRRFDNDIEEFFKKFVKFSL